MTLAARKALEDLRISHELLEREENVQIFRVLWVAAISLSRAVGHVLQKIDGSSNTELGGAISDAYSSWKVKPKENEIFFEFIENERNSVLKEYEFGFLSGPIELMVLPENSNFVLSENMFLPLLSGPFAGEDCRDVLSIAIDWWHVKLEEIDRAVAN